MSAHAHIPLLAWEPIGRGSPVVEIIEPFDDQLSHFSIFSEQITLQLMNMSSYFHLIEGRVSVFRTRDIV